MSAVHGARAAAPAQRPPRRAPPPATIAAPLGHSRLPRCSLQGAGEGAAPPPPASTRAPRSAARAGCCGTRSAAASAAAPQRRPPTITPSVPHTGPGRAAPAQCGPPPSEIQRPLGNLLTPHIAGQWRDRPTKRAGRGGCGGPTAFPHHAPPGVRPPPSSLAGPRCSLWARGAVESLARQLVYLPSCHSPPGPALLSSGASDWSKQVPHPFPKHKTRCLQHYFLGCTGEGLVTFFFFFFFSLPCS